MAKIVTPEMIELLKKSGSRNRAEALEAQAQLAVALQIPLREGVMSGEIWSEIFTNVPLLPGVPSEFPLSFLAPGTEKNYVAYTMPNHGRVPERNVEGDYIAVTTYDVANSIDWLLKYARDARWDIVEQALNVYRAGFTKKFNDDAFHTLLAAVVDRNIVVYDNAAQAGQFTKRLVSLDRKSVV